MIDALQLEGTPVQTARVWRQVGRQSGIFNLSAYATARPTSHVLMRALPISAGRTEDDEPAFLSWHRYGRGRVVYLSAPVTYRLRYRNGDRYHHRFWGQLLGERSRRCEENDVDTLEGLGGRLSHREGPVAEADHLAGGSAACQWAKLANRKVALRQHV